MIKNITITDVPAPKRSARKGIKDNVRSSLLTEIYNSI